MAVASQGLFAPGVSEYTSRHATPEDDLLKALTEETRERLGGRIGMRLTHESAALLSLVTGLVRPALAVEVGTFTGYSSIWTARALPPQARLICFDVSKEFTDIARQYWEKAGVSDRVELRLGPATETLRSLEGSVVDLAFIDAEKSEYPDYVDLLYPVLRPNGVIMLDNTLRHGAVLDPDPNDKSVAHLVNFNASLAADPRFESVLIPIGDGLTIVRKR